MSPIRGHDGAGPPLLVVVGPTAAGKSTIAEQLAESLTGELVSADALLVYRGLDIGTAKPTASTRARCAYHCIDYLDPVQRCSAGAYAAIAWQAINQVRARGKQPILVGGSGFYVQAVVEGLDEAPPSDAAWRETLSRLRERYGIETLHAALRRLDPDCAARLGSRDAQRIFRALEVIFRTGLRMSELAEASTGTGPCAPDAVWLGVTWPRPLLYERIERRVDEMLAIGWVDEVDGLLAAGVPAEAHALQAIGYRQLARVCVGELDLGAARDEIVRATRRYAKRQLAWYRRWPQICWLEHQSGEDPGGEMERQRAVRLARELLTDKARTAGRHDVAASRPESHNGRDERR